MKLFFLPTEPYQERMTYQMVNWTEAAFKRNNIDFETIQPFGLGDNAIIQNTGPLDMWRRSRWALLQTDLLLQRLAEESFSNDDAIYIQDMFHPGLESLFYIFEQLGGWERAPRIFVQNCAQSVDIYDFTYGMRGWMRHYELMTDRFVTGIFCASEIHQELMRVGGYEAPIHVTGLPFDYDEVRLRLSNAGQSIIPWDKKSNRIVFTSRFDSEKNPHLFLDVVESASSHPVLQGFSFEILQGGKFNSNDASAITRARELESKGQLTVHERLSKDDYYRLLNDSKIHLNTASQDFVSTTLNEASAFGVKSIVPCFRAFPEIMKGLSHHMYAPFSLKDIERVLVSAISSPWDDRILFPALESHKALDRVCEKLVHGRK